MGKGSRRSIVRRRCQKNQQQKEEEEEDACGRDMLSKLPTMGKGRRRGILQQKEEEEDACSSRGTGDTLSNLPNDLLLNILERVGTPDAFRTCILSKQMLNLPTMFSHIDIDVRTILCDQTIRTIRDVVRMNGAVADLTEQILSTRCPQTILHKLKLRFFLKRYDCLSIGKSVARAIATKKLDKVEFEILTEHYSGKLIEALQIDYAKQFNTFLRDCPDAFAGLTRLHLQTLRFGSESDIPNMLASCKRLESLHLQECDAGVGSVLQIVHDQLVELHITLGYFNVVELTYLPQLQRITYHEWHCDQNPIVLGFVPLLSKLSLISSGFSHPSIRLSELLATVNYISDLHLCFESEKIWVVPESPLVSSFCNLRCVNLDKIPQGCDITWTLFILEVAPFLEELSITVWDHWCHEILLEYNVIQDDYLKWEPTSVLKHDHLSKLIIYGFESDDNFIGYVGRVIQAAANLKEISLYDRKTCKPCIAKFGPETMACPSRYPQTQEEKDLVTTELLGITSSAVIFFRS